MTTRPAFHPQRPRRTGAVLLSLTLLLAPAAWASPPQEKVVCTDAPRSAWMSEEQARAAFHASDYVLVRFKISHGNCHEFYAIDAHGTVVEAYQHPVTGQAVRITRIPPPGQPTPASSPTSLSTHAPTNSPTSPAASAASGTPTH